MPVRYDGSTLTVYDITSNLLPTDRRSCPPLSRAGHALEAHSLRGAAADKAKAQAPTAYQDFLTIWKDADPEIALLRQAKAEHDKLQ